MLKASDFLFLSPIMARRLGLDAGKIPTPDGACGCSGGSATLGPRHGHADTYADVQPSPGLSDALLVSLCSGAPDAAETIPGDWPKTESRHTSGSGAYYYRSCGYFLTDYRLLPTMSTSPKMFELTGGFWDMPGAVDPEQSRPHLMEDCQRSKCSIVFFQRLGAGPWSLVAKGSMPGSWLGSCTWSPQGTPLLTVEQPEGASAAVTYRVGVRARERTSGQEAYSSIRRVLL
jgi:hypothetical protein